MYHILLDLGYYPNRADENQPETSKKTMIKNKYQSEEILKTIANGAFRTRNKVKKKLNREKMKLAKKL